MRQRLFHLFLCLVVFSGAWFCVWGYKNRSWVSIESNNISMEPAYAEGTYILNPLPPTIKGLKPGRAYAFRVPGKAQQYSVAWLVATEGQTVVCKGNEMQVDGVKPAADLRRGLLKKELKFMVPQGCVYLLQTLEEDEQDSERYGLIPFRNLTGGL